MARSNVLVSAFNGGELSPLMSARVDVDRQRIGLHRAENWVVLPQGPVTRRPGFEDRGEVKNSAVRTWLGRFLFGTADNYVLEWGAAYVRFWALGGQVLDGPDPLEVVSPYAAADLITDEHTFALQSHQEGDELFLAHGSFFPRTLARHGATDWTLDEFAAEGGPWRDLNTDDTLTIQADDVSGTVELAASDDLFLAGHVGGLIRLFQPVSVAVRAWQAGEDGISTGDVRMSDGKYYEAQNDAATGGTTKPTHTEGTVSDGKVLWLYLHSGYGWATITAVTDAQTATADVLSDLPGDVVSSATDRWQFGAWSAAYGYPSAVGSGYGRLVWAQGRSLHFSAPDDFTNYEGRKQGHVTDDDGFTVSIRAAVTIRWVDQAGERIVVGTDVGEYLIRKLTETQPFGPTNAEVVPLTSFGCRKLRPVMAHGQNLFVQRYGRRLFAQEGSISPEGNPSLTAHEHSIMAESVLKGRVTSMAWQGDPHGVLWLGEDDGTLAGFSFHPEHQVFAFHRSPLPAGAVLECVESIPAAEQHELWAIVRWRTKRRVQRLFPFWLLGDDRADAAFGDFGLLYDGPPEDTFAGLDHLAGLTVGILGDGAELAPRAVGQDGTLTLDREVSRACVGLPVRSVGEKRNLEAGAASGTAQAQKKRASRVWLRLAESGGVEVGPSDDRLVPLDRREAGDALGSPMALQSGDYEQRPWPGDYGATDRYLFAARGMRPACVVGLVVDVTVAEGD
jgi:hypothetical protein